MRELTRQDPKDFAQELTDILLECGVVLVGLPALANANLNGATKKFGNGSVLLLLTDRNKASDIFGFHFSMRLAIFCRMTFRLMMEVATLIDSLRN